MPLDNTRPAQADTTPGRICYEGYLAALQLSFPRPWTAMSRPMQAAWEAAAEAVLDAWLAQPRMETPPLDRGPGQALDRGPGQARKEHDDG